MSDLCWSNIAYTYFVIIKRQDRNQFKEIKKWKLIVQKL